jgi:hypothetical protein
VPDGLSAGLLLKLLQEITEKLAAVQRLVAQEPSASPHPDPEPNPLGASVGSPSLPALTATMEGDPTSGSFCIRFASPNQASKPAAPQSTPPDQETLSIAAKVFQLLNALYPDDRERKASPIKVFLLRFRQNLSRSEIAHECKCGTSLVSLRLRAIQQKLPWRPEQLREISAQVEAMQDSFNESRARRIYRKGAAYGDEEEEQGHD